MVAALVLVGLVGVHAATAEHEPGCTSGDSVGNNTDEGGSYAGSAPDVTVSTSQGSPGDGVRMHGCGFKPNSSVDFHLNSTPRFLRSTTTDTFGAFDVELVIPADATYGRHTITATGVDPSGSPKVESVAFAVVRPQAARAAEPRPAPISRTGTSSWTVPVVLGSAGAVALGTGLLLAARRRRSATA